MFACPIIAKSVLVICSQGKYGANIRIPYLLPYSTSGICAVVSKIICQSARKDDAYRYA